MNISEKKSLLQKEIERTGGVFRLFPTWVPRVAQIPGRRLKLHPDDLYAYGKERGGINERWLSSTIKANNGPLTTEDEGLSYIVINNSTHDVRILLKEAIEIYGDLILGERTMNLHHGLTMLSKFFDTYGAIPLHLHHRDKHAELVGKTGKAEAYYFPPQMNFIENSFPYTFFGLQSRTTKQDIIRCLERWEKGDNGIINYSNGYRITPGTGWDITTGILHSPGSLVTYEPQRAVDLGAVFQSMIDRRSISRDTLIKDIPQEKHFDLDFIVDLIDWEANIDEKFIEKHLRMPRPVSRLEDMRENGYEEYWVTYDNPHFSAKELTVYPGREVTIYDSGAYGIIVVQGRGLIEGIQMETPTVIRFGEMTGDEFFITYTKAEQGVRIKNTSEIENLVMLKHFGPTVV
ncbi:hypothetical protein O9H85_03695 [Paenibacillus filicis]|uniref:Mannose-6-phosphate isomerase n=1 Tax=Paenibacillus gyeongsangnamensis TaxID=3388067 RepID=A0ABT4Q3U3_9BACL|nr:hypothetical protein [Paenibacillus filicis]MCZ8511550.1 hypothetical protein [Paenibacillus filicis]